MIRTLLFLLAINLIIGSSSILFLDYEITFRGILWGSKLYEVNIFNIGFGIFLICLIQLSEYSKAKDSAKNKLK